MLAVMRTSKAFRELFTSNLDRAARSMDKAEFIGNQKSAETLSTLSYTQASRVRDTGHMRSFKTMEHLHSLCVRVSEPALREGF